MGLVVWLLLAYIIASVLALYYNLCDLFRNVLLVWVLGLGVVFLCFGGVYI